MWCDEIKEEQGRLVYRQTSKVRSNKLGSDERLENLDWARAKCRKLCSGGRSCSEGQARTAEKHCSLLPERQDHDADNFAGRGDARVLPEEH